MYKEARLCRGSERRPRRFGPNNYRGSREWRQNDAERSNNRSGGGFRLNADHEDHPGFGTAADNADHRAPRSTGTRNCYNCGDIDHISRDCLQLRDSTHQRPNRQPDLMHVGADFSDTNNDSRYRTHMQPEHDTSFKPPVSGDGPQRVRLCYNCKSAEHVSRQCHLPKIENDSGRLGYQNKGRRDENDGRKSVYQNPFYSDDTVYQVQGNNEFCDNSWNGSGRYGSQPVYSTNLRINQTNTWRNQNVSAGFKNADARKPASMDIRYGAGRAGFNSSSDEPVVERSRHNSEDLACPEPCTFANDVTRSTTSFPLPLAKQCVPTNVSNSMIICPPTMMSGMHSPPLPPTDSKDFSDTKGSSDTPSRSVGMLDLVSSSSISTTVFKDAAVGAPHPAPVVSNFSQLPITSSTPPPLMHQKSTRQVDNHQNGENNCFEQQTKPAKNYERNINDGERKKSNSRRKSVSKKSSAEVHTMNESFTELSVELESTVEQPEPVVAKLEVAVKKIVSDKYEQLKQILDADSDNWTPTGDFCFKKKTVVFCDLRRMADYLALCLSNHHLSSLSAHDAIIDYEKDLEEFADGLYCAFCCSTSCIVDPFIDKFVISRGPVDHVIVFDIPRRAKEFKAMYKLAGTNKLTVFFDGDDAKKAKDLCGFLHENGESVPACLKKLSQGANIKNQTVMDTSSINVWD